MTSLRKTVLSCLGVAIASGLIHAPASAQQEKAAALGGPLTPSNPALFQTQAEPTDTKIKLDNKDQEQALQTANAPMDWQSEHLLDDQRQFDSNVSIINIDLK